MAADVVEFHDVLAVAETDKGLCVVIEDEEVWLPKSQIDDDSEVYRRGTEGTLIVSRWIAEKKGLT